MQALKVQIKNGRIVVDEPTNLPDGAEVEVVVIDDKLTTEERAELHASLDRALDDSEAGRSIDARVGGGGSASDIGSCTASPCA